MELQHSSFPILTLILAGPLAGAALVALVPRAHAGLVRALGLGVALAVFAASLLLWVGFDSQFAGFQFVEDHSWIGHSIRYVLGVDGLSLLLVLLTTFLTPLTLLGAVRAIGDRVKEFVICMLLLETGMLGALIAIDLFLFYVFWELMLVPMYLIIGIWGGPRRVYAAVKFFIYTMFGSVLMLAAILYLYVKTGSSTFGLVQILDFVGGGQLSFTEQMLLFSAFALSFAIKVPVFPFHTWLPDAHVEAPTPGSVILAGVLLKLGTYGFVRFAIPLFPQACGAASPVMMGLAVIGILYGAFTAYAQEDIKKLVAYSSVSHLGFVMLGLFAMTESAVSGSLLQMVNHGLSTGALFLLVGMLYERRHTRNMSDFGGLARIMPAFAVAFMIVTLSSIGLPGTNGFVGEFLILAGTFRDGLMAPIGSGSGFQPELFWRVFGVSMGVLATAGVILGAVYMLTMYRRVMFGPVTHAENRALPDLSWRERIVLLPILALIFLIGLAPNVLLSKTEASVRAYVNAYRTPVLLHRAPGAIAVWEHQRRMQAQTAGDRPGE